MLKKIKNIDQDYVSLRGRFLPEAIFVRLPACRQAGFVARIAPRNDSGFSLVEVIVASLIFATVVVGIFATTSAMKKPTVDSDKKLMAAFYGKQILEDLRVRVDQRDWDKCTPATPALSGSLTVIGACNPHVPITIFNPTYNTTFTFTYIVTDVPGGSGARDVALTVTWL